MTQMGHDCDAERNILPLVLRGFHMLRVAMIAMANLMLVGSAAAQVTTSTNEHGTWRNGCDQSYCYLTVPVNLTADPSDIFHLVQSCANSAGCVGAISAAIAAFGGDPSIAPRVATMYRVSYSVIRGRSNGNEHWIYVSPPDGTVACSVRWSVWSVNRATISAQFRHDRSEIMFYANVPVRRFGQGRTWIKGVFELRFSRIGPCHTPSWLESNQYGTAFVNTNDPTRPYVRDLAGDTSFFQ